MALGFPASLVISSLARLGLLGHRDVHRQHAIVETGLDVIRVKALTEEKLSGEGPVRPLGGQNPVRSLGLPRPARPRP